MTKKNDAVFHGDYTMDELEEMRLNGANSVAQRGVDLKVLKTGEIALELGGRKLTVPAESRDAFLVGAAYLDFADETHRETYRNEGTFHQAYEGASEFLKIQGVAINDDAGRPYFVATSGDISQTFHADHIEGFMLGCGFTHNVMQAAVAAVDFKEMTKRAPKFPDDEMIADVSEIEGLENHYAFRIGRESKSITMKFQVLRDNAGEPVVVASAITTDNPFAYFRDAGFAAQNQRSLVSAFKRFYGDEPGMRMAG